MATPTAGAFRTAFPAFADTSIFPNGQVDFFLKIHTQLVNADRWDTLTDYGIFLATAHVLTLEAQSAKAVAVGGVPGLAVGVLNSKKADKLATGYDVNVASEQGAGFWNLTNYGSRFWHYCQMFGAGPIQVGAPDGTQGFSAQVGAWPGPYTWPFS